MTEWPVQMNERTTNERTANVMYEQNIPYERTVQHESIECPM